MKRTPRNLALIAIATLSLFACKKKRWKTPNGYLPSIYSSTFLHVYTKRSAICPFSLLLLSLTGQNHIDSQQHHTDAQNIFRI